jgi:methyltransferase (TIGR00027 family)
MQGSPSSTAGRVALGRAAHQLLEEGAIFRDPLAVAIVGEDAEAITRAAAEFPRLRLFVVVRSRFAEDGLAKAVERGVRQAVVLGAGLDTLGLRNPFANEGLRVFEVDHPATQQWKRACLDKANLTAPDSLSFVALDFEHQDLIESLTTAGLKTDRPAYFIWLGVVPYLSRDAVFATLSAIARVPGAEVVFDYGKPPQAYPANARAGYEAMIARAAADGEPWLTFFDPPELHAVLSSIGFSEMEDLGPADIAVRYFGQPNPTPNAPGGHIVRARRA